MLQQVRECYGRAVYTHKTHQKAADIILTWNGRIKLTQIIISALITTSVIAAFFDENGKVAIALSAILSASLTCMNAYLKDFDLGELAQKHRDAANDIWLVREKYLSLITDLVGNTVTLEQAVERRDMLLSELHAAYSAAPNTNAAAYKKAQTALKNEEELTFSSEEIDKLLPPGIRSSESA